MSITEQKTKFYEIEKMVQMVSVAASNIGYTFAPIKLSGEGWRFFGNSVTKNTTRP